jgi:hypothetical protein
VTLHGGRGLYEWVFCILVLNVPVSHLVTKVSRKSSDLFVLISNVNLAFV